MELSNHIAYFIYFNSEGLPYSPVVPSRIITSPVLGCLKFLPKNLVQIKKPHNYFGLISTGEHLTNNRLFLSSGFPAGHESLLSFDIGVVLWDMEELPPENLKKSFNMPIVFRDVHTSRHKNLNIRDFVYSIIKEIERIVREDFLATSSVRKLFLSKEKPLKGVQENTDFNPCITNYSIISQINGWFTKKINFSPIKVLNERPARLLESIKKLDAYHSSVRSDFPESEDSYSPYYPVPTLIMICPWINPLLMNFKNVRQLADRINKSYDEAFLFGKTLTTEQDKHDYRFHIEKSVFQRIKEDMHLKSIHIAQMVGRSRIAADDNIGTLHSSFQLSPVLRLPLVGKSIDVELSWFSPKNLSKRKDQSKNYRKLLELGEALTCKITNETKEYLTERTGPICFISDLPMEIATIDQVPMFFLKDVCRLPETNHESALSEYVKHSMSEYRISEDLLEKTLVVCTNPSDEKIKSMFEAIRDQIQKLNGCKKIRFEFCRSIQEMAIMVKEFKPELLIIDTHGGTREDHLDSFLVVENEKLTCEEIVKHKISAPLVILSSCLTAPTYGYIAPLAHGFFEAGSHSVLSSILPLAMVGANVLYFRILNNLQKALKENIHDSWAGFISHNLRTSLFDDYKNYVSTRVKKGNEWIDGTKYQDIRVMWQVESFYDESRSKAFKEVGNKILEITKSEFKEKVKLVLKDLDGFTPDAFAYTLMGRADLIKMPQRLNLYEKYIKSLKVPTVGRSSKKT